MNPFIRHFLAIWITLCGLVLGAASKGADSAELDRLFGLGPVETFTLRSDTLERDFYVYVRLPQQYDESDCDWPVVYMLDGGILFPMLAPYHFMLEIDELASPAVLVGISYGGLGFANGNLRSTDYTAPAPEPEFYGGASDYQKFLAEDLIPRINRDFRVDHRHSLVLGQSLGGQFTLYTALTRPELFAAYLAINPALHRNVDHFIELEPTGRDQPARLMITRASEDGEAFRVALDRWLAHWRAAESDALDLSVESLEDQHHASSAPAAYRAALEWWAPDAGCSEARED